MLPETTELAPGATVKDWKAFAGAQPEAASADTWKDIIAKFYQGRLQSRYFDPINKLQHGPSLGEGFAIVAIQCSLIEFLEGCVQGVNYKYARGGPPLGSHEYSESMGIFRSFLSTRDPFRNDFTPALAEDFYRKVRCGLLHEARTHGTWLVHDRHSSGRCLEPTTPILYRDNFQRAIESFAKTYAADVPGDPRLRAAFVRKFNHLCQ
jgi:hypothetical protein